MDIIVDTREQLPLFKRGIIRYKLNVGDYSTKNLMSCFSIERKSPADLYSTITKGNVRFKNELLRARDNNIKLVVYVESTRKNFVAKNFPGGSSRKFPSSGLDKIINTFQDRYKLEFVWCRSRDLCKRKVVERLELEEKKLRYEIRKIKRG